MHENDYVDVSRIHSSQAHLLVRPAKIPALTTRHALTSLSEPANQNANAVEMSGTKSDKAVIPFENCDRHLSPARRAVATHLHIPDVIWTRIKPNTHHAHEVHPPHSDAGETDGGSDE